MKHIIIGWIALLLLVSCRSLPDLSNYPFACYSAADCQEKEDVQEKEDICIPDCASKECGEDECEGTCGECISPFFCESDKCICNFPCDVTSAIPDTGVNKCYDNSYEITCPSYGQEFSGQDAQYETNPMSFTDNGDGTIKDNVTGLIWQKCSAGQNKTDCSGTALGKKWTEANTYCTNNSAGLPGTGWRLPDRFELQSIVDYGASFPAIDPKFPNTQTSYYWASVYAPDTNLAWYVHFNNGSVFYISKDYTFYVRCVRSGQ
jgi:hypothetical protein